MPTFAISSCIRIMEPDKGAPGVIVWIGGVSFWHRCTTLEQAHDLALRIGVMLEVKADVAPPI